MRVLQIWLEWFNLDSNGSNDITNWVDLRLSIHAQSSAIDTPSGERTVHVKENASLPTL